MVKQALQSLPIESESSICSWCSHEFCDDCQCFNFIIICCLCDAWHRMEWIALKKIRLWEKRLDKPV
jgi:hypothetical protein